MLPVTLLPCITNSILVLSVLFLPSILKKHRAYTVGVLFVVGVFLALANVSPLIMVSVPAVCLLLGDWQEAIINATQNKLMYFIFIKQ